MANMKCEDNDGIVVEMVKNSCVEMKTEILREFNYVLHSGNFEDNWHHIIFQMLPKEGHLSKVVNWSPIAILPCMYKIFSKLLYNRFSSVLFDYQSRDQHAFTPGKRIEDALACAEVAIANAIEFNSPLWLLSIDLRKAFDTVTHDYIFQALGYHGLSPSYITLLRKLYSGQRVSVYDSRQFDVKCGVKQSDVLSAIIFNYVIDVAIGSSLSSFKHSSFKHSFQSAHVIRQSCLFDLIEHTRIFCDIRVFVVNRDRHQSIFG